MRFELSKPLPCDDRVQCIFFLFTSMLRDFSAPLLIFCTLVICPLPNGTQRMFNAKVVLIKRRNFHIKHRSRGFPEEPGEDSKTADSKEGFHDALSPVEYLKARRRRAQRGTTRNEAVSSRRVSLNILQHSKRPIKLRISFPLFWTIRLPGRSRPVLHLPRHVPPAPDV